MLEYVIAKYIRLSIDDGITDSLSIPNQRKQLDKHIISLEIPNAAVIEFIDNGYSGTNTKRPAFQDMLEMINKRKIHCVIVKDFSRFSRNALECGHYIDNLFPMFGIRFISVNDYFDSKELGADTGGIDVSFKYIIHEYYSQDISKKVKSVKRNQMARGANIVSNAIYGYLKNDNGRWEPDPVAADVVKQIYKMALDGMTTSQIRDILSAKHYPTPREYIEIKRGKNIKPSSIWTARMVYHILTNEQYTGSYISGKQESKKIGSHSKINIDKSQWIVFTDSHPAIVCKSDFEKVQELLLCRKGSTTTKPINSPLSDVILKPRRQHMIAGERKTAVPIYGYNKTKDGKLEIDEAAASVIRSIFKMASENKTYAEISAILTSLECPRPSEYIALKRGHGITPSCRWTNKSIRDILKNEQYTGAYVAGRILKDYDTGRSYHTPKNEWITIPDKHPAIVSKEMFSRVQLLIAEKKSNRQNNRTRTHLLSGKVFCGCCGYALMYDNSAYTKLYRCNHTLANPSKACHRMKADAAKIDKSVWNMVKKKAETLMASLDEYSGLNADENTEIPTSYESQITELEKLRKDLYLEYIFNRIDQETFLCIKNEYTNRIDDLANHANALQKSCLKNTLAMKPAERSKEVIGGTSNPNEIINNCIEKIYIFPNHEIKICFNDTFSTDS